MGGRIPRQFIDDLIGRVDIVQVIDERVPLRKAGRDYVACCPFHGEKTPSFTVSPDKQFYHCFGCGAHGTAIGFLMEYGHMEFPDAVRELAARAGLQVPSEGGDAAQPDLSPLYSVLEEAAGFFRRQLRTHPAASRAVQYLKSRGLSGQTAAEFGLGYAPPGWEELTVALGAGRAELLAQAGLVLAGRSEGGKPYDRFRDRVMFPILDRQGRTVGFGGRTIGDGTPKYLNSPETPVFHKGREVYGLHRARRLERQPARLVVVEGYMDVLALAEFGVPGAVATLGTAATAEQLSQMFRLTPHLLFCFDGDDAGRRAAWRALETVLPLLGEGRQASFAFLPEKEDPDSLVRREGASAFEERLRSATGLPELLFARIAGQVDLGTLDGRARLVDLARPLLARLPAGALRQLMHQRLAELAQMEPPEPAGPPGAPRLLRARHPSATRPWCAGRCNAWCIGHRWPPRPGSTPRWRGCAWRG
jgi:DNA primase